MGGLFNQPAAHTLALSAHPQANSVPSTFHTWDQPDATEPHAQWLTPHIDNNNQTLSYIDKPGSPTDEPGSPTDEPGSPTDEPTPCNGPPQDRPPHFDLHAPHTLMPPLHQNAPAPPRQPMGPRAPQPPFPANPPCLPPVLVPNSPTDANYFGSSTPRGPPGKVS
ncbi:hypothetical protein C0989_009471 [Termitomyces sp. Mn162]|nr:hypothetical protein C0989_009471 [Termitomyces sp. Mn162]